VRFEACDPDGLPDRHRDLLAADRGPRDRATLLDKIPAGWPTRLTRLGVTATLGLLLLSQAWCAPRQWSEPVLPASLLAVSEREGGWVMSTGRNAGAAAGGGAIYGLGIFGALVYFWQQADTFWEYLLAVVQGLFWPAFMVYEVFKALRRSG
jgi:hypothetical protein